MVKARKEEIKEAVAELDLETKELHLKVARLGTISEVAWRVYEG